MIFVLLFLAELLTLFALSRFLTNALFHFFYKTTRSKKISIYLMSLLFWPGTLIHELSHALMAGLLGVHVGEIEFMPKLIGNNLKLGSVEIAKTDPVRRIFIGTAPFIFGISILLGTFFFAVQYDLFGYWLSVIVIGYIVFEIGNTMFSSRKDMEGALEVVVAVILISSIFYIVGFRLTALNPEILFSNPLFKETFQKITLYLTAPIGIDIIVILLLKIIRS